MTSKYRSFFARHCPVRTGIAFLLLLGTALAFAASSACGGTDDPTTNNFIGVTDATPPRLGPEDGGTRR
ncbi:MAG TPA: hypothetical protein VK550_10485 [Polyangiaceae bacterium]|jgi:hypothetical protein|nr:hypothetical protein [Polyangiaceae bacterium]